MATAVKTPAKTLAPLKPKQKPGKTKKQSAAFKNLLAQTFPRYWPQLSAEHSEELFALLIKAKSTHPDWFTAKRSTESRPVFYGLQSTCKKIRSGRVKLLVLSSDLKPRYVINQLILKAISSNDGIHILLVPGLNGHLEGIVGFPCFAFVVDQDGCQQLAELNGWCGDILRIHHPVPDTILSYYAQRRRVLANANDINMDDNASMPIKSANEPENTSQFLLHRDANCDQRAFVPQNAALLRPVAYNVQTLNQTKSDFISLDLLGGASQAKKRPKKEKKKSPQLYQPLVIHKVQNSSGERLSKALQKKNKGK